MKLTYSIKELESLSGIKAHTLRIWEQRYGLLKAERSASNIREYSNEDLRLLLNISVLYNNGLRISEIADIPAKNIYSQVDELISSSTELEDQISALTIAMVELNSKLFDRIYNQNIERLGILETYKQVLRAFMHRIGNLWMVGDINPGQEHFITNLIREKVIVAIHNLKYSSKKNAKTYLLFCPEGELHELSLLFHQVLILESGNKVIYLGSSIPLSSLRSIVHLKNPDRLLFTATSSLKKRKSLRKSIDEICNSFPTKLILGSGSALLQLGDPLPKNLHLLHHPDELLKELD